MIQITGKHIETIAKQYADNVKHYLSNDNAEKITFAEIDTWTTNELNISYYDLLLAKPEKLETIITNIQNSIFLYNLISVYKRFADKKRGIFGINGKYTGFDLVSSLGISVCPYCNRSYINSIDENRKRTCELDHFYPKTEYPLLALCFYNLIPSCKVCNHIKRTKPITYNPYSQLKNDNKIHFSLKIKSADFYYNPSAVEIKLPESEQLKDNIKVFGLESLYQNHCDWAVELVQKQYIYNDDYLESLFKQYEGTLFKNMEDLKGRLFGNYISESEMGKRPLAKLTKDLIEQIQ